jgi:hypothetical protein
VCVRMRDLRFVELFSVRVYVGKGLQARADGGTTSQVVLRNAYMHVCLDRCRSVWRVCMCV